MAVYAAVTGRSLPHSSPLVHPWMLEKRMRRVCLMLVARTVLMHRAYKAAAIGKPLHRLSARQLAAHRASGPSRSF
jgi:hypothetical protein